MGWLVWVGMVGVYNPWDGFGLYGLIPMSTGLMVQMYE